jgi:hypothetical protein
VGIVVDKVALGQVFSEYFGFPCHFHSTNYSTITLIYHLGLYNRPEVAAVPSGLRPAPLRIIIYNTGVLTEIQTENHQKIDARALRLLLSDW